MPGAMPSMDRNWCVTGALVYLVAGFILYMVLLSPSTGSLPVDALGFVLAVGLLVVALAAFITVLFILGASALAALLVAAVLWPFGVRVGLSTLIALFFFLFLASTTVYHLWGNAKYLRSTAKNTRSRALRTILIVSSTSYQVLAALGAAAIVLTALGYLVPLPKTTHELTSSQLDAALAALALLLATGKTGLATALLMAANTRTLRAAGALHLVAAALAVAMAYYLLGPLLHLPATPQEPPDPFNLLSQQEAPAVIAASFTLAGLTAWGLTTPNC